MHPFCCTTQAAGKSTGAWDLRGHVTQHHVDVVLCLLHMLPNATQLCSPSQGEEDARAAAGQADGPCADLGASLHSRSLTAPMLSSWLSVPAPEVCASNRVDAVDR